MNLNSMNFWVFLYAIRLALRGFEICPLLDSGSTCGFVRTGVVELIFLRNLSEFAPPGQSESF